ncbi:universal stress protein [Halomicrococcus sp. NG-SE-24]|uniref:universal stress protein n=1 Tax=Halomicrococcus sp. NG-SE-24 TaxID=3436928 RepID=UPI003D95990C
MSSTLFQRIIVPVANKDDAEATTAALTPYVDATTSTVIAVHVIEKAGGAPDKASVEQRELFADEAFERVADGLEDVELQTEYLYGTDVAAAIIDAAHDLDASAIVITPRGSSQWLKLLTGDVTAGLVNKSDIPIIVLPDHSDEEDTQ